MGGVLGKRYKKSCCLKERTRLLEDELVELRCKSAKENWVHEQETSLFMAKEAKWKRERKRWTEEAKRLKKSLKEKEETIKRLEERGAVELIDRKDDKEWQLLGATVLVEHLRGEQALREEAAGKWKRLYFAMKTELDDLILRTHHGWESQRLLWGNNEVEVMEGLQRELKAKEETVEALRARVVGLDKEVIQRERQVDMMRQSLRILSHTEQGRIPSRKSLSRNLHSRKNQGKKK